MISNLSFTETKERGRIVVEDVSPLLVVQECGGLDGLDDGHPA
jgi:hypothetical protein